MNESTFPDDPKTAIKNGFERAEEEWTNNHALKGSLHDGTETIVDRSGSCAIVVLIIDEMCYVVNVGDSRAILSGNSGSRIFPLSRDHKPTD